MQPNPAAEHEAVAALRAGQVFATVLDHDPARRSLVLERVVDQLADLRTRFVRIGNPLRAKLTFERLLIQAAGSDAESYYDRTEAELTRIIAGPVHDERRVVLVVEQAETLDPEAVRVLQGLAGLFARNMPSVHVLFAGEPAFQPMLAGTPPAPILPAPTLPAPAPTPAPPAEAMPPPPAVEPPIEYLPVPPREMPAGRRWLLLVLALLVLAAAAVAIVAADSTQAARMLDSVRSYLGVTR